MEGRLDMETSNRPRGRISRSLAFWRGEKGEVRTAAQKGPKPLRGTPLSDSPARRETPTALNLSNRRIRTRTYGGVGGEESRDSPLSRSGPSFIGDVDPGSAAHHAARAARCAASGERWAHRRL